MKKGFVKMHLKTFLEVVVGFLIIFVIIEALNVSGFAAGSLAVGASASQLGEAINTVYNCIEAGETGCSETVKINLPQKVEKDIIGGTMGYDPLWAIWHKTYLPEIDPIKNEQDLWDLGIVKDRCDNDLCFGLLERKSPGRASVKPEAIAKLKPFWMIDPCYVEIMVRDDGSGNIELCYVKTIEGPGKYNFCSGSKWPDKSDIDSTTSSNIKKC